jgi:hypothetical protein
MSLQSKIQQFIGDSTIIHDIVHGGPTTVVQTEGGPVESFAKVTADAIADIRTDVLANTFTTIGPVPPSNPLVGKEWVNTNTGRRYIWLDDGTGLKWVEAGSIVYQESLLLGTVNGAGYVGTTSSAGTVQADLTNLNTTKANSADLAAAGGAALVGSTGPSTVQADLTNLSTTKANSSDLTAHTSNTSNPHAVTKAQVGLGNVDNTSDTNKPVSTAQATALALKTNVADLAATTGAALVGSTGPSTVQADINARPTSATLAASGGSALVGFTQSDINAVPRNLQDRLRDAIEAKDFGVTANGSTDDWANLTNAIAFAQATSGIVLLPLGVIVISATINVPAGVVLVGRGRGTTALTTPTTGTILSYAGTGDAVSLNGSLAGLARLSIVGTSSATGSGVLVNGNGNTVESWCLEHITIYGFTGGNGLKLYGINSGAVAYGTAIDLRIRHAKTGLLINDTGGGSGFVNTNQFYGGCINGGGFDYAIRVQGGNDNRFYGMSVEPPSSNVGHFVVETGEIKFDGRLEGSTLPTTVPIINLWTTSANTTYIKGMGGSGTVKNASGALIEMMSGKYAEPQRPADNIFPNPGFIGVDTTAHTIPEWTIVETGGATTWTLDTSVVIPGCQTIRIDVPASGNVELKPTSLTAKPEKAEYFASMGLWVKTSTAQAAFARLVSSVGLTTGGFHSGSGLWEAVSMAQTISNGSYLDPRFELPGGVSGATYYIAAPYFAYGIAPVRNTPLLKQTGGILYGTLEGGMATITLPVSGDNTYYTSATNEVTLPKWGNAFHITGTARTITRLNNLTANRMAKGTQVQLIFDIGSVTVTNGAFITLTTSFTSTTPSNSAGRTWLLLESNGDGTWYEINRANNSVTDYTALRAYSGRSTQITVTSTGISGVFVYDSTDTTSSDNGGTIIVDSANRRWKRIYSGKISVKWFGAKGDGTTDDTAAFQAWATACVGTSGIVPNATYKFTTALSFAGFDIDFDGSSLFYAGASGVFALTLNSDASGGSTQSCGNTFDNFTLYQSNFSALVTNTAVVAYDPPSISTGSAISNISPGGVSTVVTVTGATTGGYARATFDQIVDGVEVTARVTANDQVTVTFSNYTAGAIDLAAGNITVTAVNNAYHGLCVSGPLGKMRNAKVRGFTGVSFAMGGGVIDVTSGVTLPGTLGLCYYWDADLNVAPAVGWGAIIPPRSNVNNISLSTFPFDAYGDSIPKRANCINHLVIGGISNTFPRLSMEANASEDSILFVGNANDNRGLGVAYIEYNTSYATPPFPRIHAKGATSANIFRFRHPYQGKAILDTGGGNDLQVLSSNFVGGMQLLSPVSSRNLVTNGDFENGTSGWSDFSSGSVLTVTGTGVFSGKRARYDITAGRPNLQQDLVAIGGFPVSGLIGQNITVGAWIRTNIVSVKPRINGSTGNTGTVGDSTDEFISVTYKVPVGATSIPLSIITDASGLTGFIEMSNITAVIGLNPIAFGERTQPVGSATYNPPSLTTGTETTTTVTVTGAALGDYAIASFSLDTQGIKINARVSAADTVTVTFRNDTGGTLDLASGTLRARVVKV